MEYDNLVILMEGGFVVHAKLTQEQIDAVSSPSATMSDIVAFVQKGCVLKINESRVIAAYLVDDDNLLSMRDPVSV